MTHSLSQEFIYFTLNMLSASGGLCPWTALEAKTPIIGSHSPWAPDLLGENRACLECLQRSAQHAETRTKRAYDRVSVIKCALITTVHCQQLPGTPRYLNSAPLFSRVRFFRQWPCTHLYDYVSAMWTSTETFL